ncbi:tol-pal system protein YbgF [Ottowia sp.]|uniref:tol-pal system protein YbgF n=1 Tax=Ottowia sp. TaxID=1898956 RepID=UPI002B9C8B7D|nr:tol-pal system protein YbgF [Ottowia sp.]HOB65856.1 tol-pal system protein YbgF [Ottowia sp.]HPZ58818.1 tol-pal system protein YbgF [Ottowia sp.]HQD46780.1 tol-pal system protein YbgF [Ottowia sp.]
MSRSVTADRIVARTPTLFRGAVLALACVAGQGAQAQLFGDDQARQAILDLRQRFDQSVTAQNRLVEENTQMRRSLLDLQQQIESLRGELARGRGQEEQFTRDIGELKRAQTGQQQTLEERLRRLESSEASRASNDAAASTAAPTASAAAPALPASDAGDKRDYDAALAVFRAGDFKGAQTGFASFIKRYPRSSLAPSALFWLGNAQYATRDYKEAITNFRSLLTASPNHQRAPEAMLSIANCQIELKDSRAARATLESLVKTYPQSEAAQAGRERLSRLK